MTSFADFTEDDKRLHDFIITHNRKLKDIKTIVNNIMWSLCALRDAFEFFEFIKQDENNLASIIRSYGFTPGFSNNIYHLIEEVKYQLASAQRYSTLQTIAHKHNLQPDDILKVAKTNFVDLCNKQ